jgi:hypothetical protein
MMPKKPESKLVRLVMTDATEAEIEEATRGWFSFLQILNQIAIEVEQAAHDSPNALQDDRFKNASFDL